MLARIDTHKDALAVAVVDQVGLPVARAEEPNTRAGLVRIGQLLATHQVVRSGSRGRATTGAALPPISGWTGIGPTSRWSRCRR